MLVIKLHMFRDILAPMPERVLSTVCDHYVGCHFFVLID
jgi:hypothetical protein